MISKRYYMRRQSTETSIMIIQFWSLFLSEDARVCKEKLDGSRKLATIASQSEDSSKGYQYTCQIVDRDYSLYVLYCTLVRGLHASVFVQLRGAFRNAQGYHSLRILYLFYFYFLLNQQTYHNHIVSNTVMGNNDGHLY